MELDILPFNSNRYYPKPDDIVIGIVKSKNFEFFTLDINSESHATLNALEH
jgi:exosome complex RNA-binding protein Rrp4